MAMGFEVYNSAGALQVDSQHRNTLVSDVRNITGLTDIGYYMIKNPFGGDYPFGFLKPADNPVPGYLYWVQLNPGAFCFPGAQSFQNNSGRILRTSRSVPIQSGYLDVLDPNGNLVWSAKSANLAPRIRGFLELKPNSNVDNVTVSTSPGFNPWFLMNAVPGNISDDGTVNGYSGVIIRWTGSELQARYVSKYQNTFANSFGKRVGLRIPYAQFADY